MNTITIRRIDDALKQRLRVRAAQHGRSMEAEIRAILAEAVEAEAVEAEAVDAESIEPRADDAPRSDSTPWFRQLHEAAIAVGGVDLTFPPRTVDEHRIPEFGDTERRLD